MRAWLHILLGAVLATPAAALTPLPPCSGQKLEGKYEIWESHAAGDGFVTYYGKSWQNEKVLLVLEHCKTGKSVVVDTFWNDGADKRGNLDDAIDVLDDYVESDRNYSLSAIRRGLKKAGVKARQTTLGPESCACSILFPELRGNREEYAY